MGFSIAWLAFTNKSKSQVLSSFGLADTGALDEANECPVSGATAPGWFILFLNDIDHAFVQPEALARASVGCTVVVCQVEEHIMVSAAFCYQDGQEQWDVTHDSELGLEHLEESGALPDLYTSLKHKHMEEASPGTDQAFDVPVLLAYEVVGYRHDNIYLKSGEQATFTKLVPSDA